MGSVYMYGLYSVSQGLYVDHGRGGRTRHAVNRVLIIVT